MNWIFYYGAKKLEKFSNRILLLKVQYLLWHMEKKEDEENDTRND